MPSQVFLIPELIRYVIVVGGVFVQLKTALQPFPGFTPSDLNRKVIHVPDAVRVSIIEPPV